MQQQSAAPGAAKNRRANQDDALRTLFEQLRVVNSAWSILSSYELSAETRHIAEGGRAVSGELAQLAGQPPELRDMKLFIALPNKRNNAQFLPTVKPIPRRRLR